MDLNHGAGGLGAAAAAAAAAAAGALVPLPTGSGRDSGVETEGGEESNDSSMSSVSIGQNNVPGLAQVGVAAAGEPFYPVADGGPGAAVPVPAVEVAVAASEDVASDVSLQAGPSGLSSQRATSAAAASTLTTAEACANISNGVMSTPTSSAPGTPEPPLLSSPSPCAALPSTSSGSGAASSAISFQPPSSVVPPPSVTEDGYLGDCSSDGGNEMNFPISTEKLKRLLCQTQRNNGGSGHQSGSETGGDPVEPTSTLAFKNYQPDLLGYQVLNTPPEGAAAGPANLRGGAGAGRGSHGGNSRKMRSFHRNRLANHNQSWSQMRTVLAEKKLRISANLNDVEAVERLLGSGASPNGTDEHKRTALHFGAAKGYDGVVRVLLQNGADPNQRDTLGNTALHLAACTNHIGVVTLLLRAGTDVSQIDNNGRTPMQLAQSKLKMLQRRKNQGAVEMVKVKKEVAQVLEMMREYLSKTGYGTNPAYNDLLNSFSHRLTLHTTHDDINSDLQNLLDSLGNLQV